MPPRHIKEMFCRLCLNSINNENGQVIEEFIREVLRGVLPNLNLEESVKHFMCKECSVKLFAAFNFKSACMGTEDIVTPFVNASKESVTDLSEIYLKANGNVQLTGLWENQRICRLCIQLVTNGFVSLREVDVDIINTYIPQVNISATRDPIVCELCFDSLCTHGRFIKNCLDAQERCKREDNEVFIKTEQNEVKLEDDLDAQEKYKNVNEQPYIKPEEIKLENGENVQENCKNVDKLCYFTSEEIDIKVEEDRESKCTSYNLNGETVGHKRKYTLEDGAETKDECMLKCETGFNKNCTTSTSIHSFSLSKGEKKNYEHKNISEIRMYKCDSCTYETKCQSHLREHELTHKDPSEVQMYKCDQCDFETKFKNNIKVHQLKHKDPSEIKMFKCDACTYETKYKSSLRNHRLIHKDILEVKTYKCDICDHESKRKGHLKMHQLIHKVSEMYKCDTCSYITIFKSSLKRHQLSHKDPSEIEMYKCDRCSYETNFKSSLKTHRISHKNSSEIQLYKCDRCTYETKYKGGLKTHQLVHKDPSEIPMYKCDICSFETKYKKNLKHHRVTHGNLRVNHR